MNLLLKPLNFFCFSRHRHLSVLENRCTYYTRSGLITATYITLVVLRECTATPSNSKGLASAVRFVTYYGWILVAITAPVLINLSETELTTFFAGIHKFRIQLGFLNTQRNIKLITTLNIIKLSIQQLPVIHNSDVINHLVYTLSSLSLFLIIALWMTCIIMLNDCFKHLNELLKTLRFTHCWMVEDYKLKLEKWSLKECALLYNELCGLSKVINSVFGTIILLFVSMLFLELIYDTFTICHMIQRNADFDLRFIIRAIVGVICFLEIVLPCITLKEEADKFVNGLNKFDLSGGCDGVHNMMMNNLTLQTYHLKVHLTAHNTFSLDGTLVYSVFGAITTYLVILLQFDN